MSRSIRCTRNLVAAGAGFCSALLLASCGEAPMTPQPEGYSVGVPLAALSTEFDSYQFLGFVLDDAGANDTPSQSDLNAFTRADNVAGKVGVKWVWDDINAWTGTGQTGDACALFDTDGDTKANAAVCVRISNPNGDPTLVSQLAAPASPLVYSCGDSKADRCASPVRLASSLGGTICEVEKIDGETFFPAGEDGADVLAACSIPLSAISATATPNLLNVCSFPSGSPNSNAFDCVVTPGAGFLVIKKATTPQSSGETFSFTITPSVVSGSSQSLTDTTANVEETSLLSALPGSTYRVKEGSIPTDWHLNSAICARQTSPNPTATGTQAGDSVTGISITSGETTVCTFTNGRNQGSIELKKVWVGGGSQTTLNIGTTAAGSETASQLTGAAGATPLTTGAQTVNTGTYYVSETGGLDDYGSQLACTNKGNAITVGSSNSVSVATGDVVVCTFTNTRNQGSVELKKVWSGTPGQTTLKIGTSAAGSETASQLTGAAGASPLTTGVQNVVTGTYYFSETGGLTEYTSQIACTNKGNPISVGSNNSVQVATGDVVVCTFTNTRDQGSIELKKVWSGTAGQTTLNIGTSADGTQVASQLTGAAGATPLTTGAQTVNTGTYYVSETGGLTNYSSQLACTNKGDPISVGGSNSVSVAKGDVIVCTFTNTRNQGSIELKKVWVGQSGQTTLNIGTSASGSQVASELTGPAGAAPLTTGAQTVNTGTYYVSETGGLAAFSAQLACTSNGNSLTVGSSNSVAVATNAVVVCTFTNTATPPSISVVKTASPDSIPETGGNVTYSVVVTNNAAFPVTLASLVDSVFGDLSGVGTCNSPSSPTNPYGVMAPSGTYTCSFQKTLAASNAGVLHINKVTASVTSDGGPASASDTARVKYTDVKPDFSVAKSADSYAITATGGTSVAGFTPDITFSGSGGGGGGSGSPIFASQICDDAGANDVPAQSDLDCFTRADNVSGYIYLKWTWDDINSWTGSGQTGDACALIDSDNSGFANFSFCVRITNPGGDPTVIAQVSPGSPLLYACKDKEADRCSSPITPKTLDALSTCTISLVPEHFQNGDDGQDVQAECKLKLTDLGQNASIQNLDLLNVC